MLYTANMIDRINNSFLPESSQKIARYMGFDRFKEMIEKRYLWMANAESFMDAFEGEIPKGFFEHWDEKSTAMYSTLKKLKDNIYSAYINCWFNFERESELMWLAYGGQKKPDDCRDNCGVCVISNVEKLMKYTKQFNAVVYKVRYIELSQQNSIDPPFFFAQENNEFLTTRIFYVYKQKEYEAEKEIRTITYRRSKAEGLKVTINPEDFITNIIINPHASIELKQNIGEYLSNIGFNDKVIKSKIESKF